MLRSISLLTHKIRKTKNLKSYLPKIRTNASKAINNQLKMKKWRCKSLIIITSNNWGNIFNPKISNVLKGEKILTRRARLLPIKKRCLSYRTASATSLAYLEADLNRSQARIFGLMHLKKIWATPTSYLLQINNRTFRKPKWGKKRAFGKAWWLALRPLEAARNVQNLQTNNR